MRNGKGIHRHIAYFEGAAGGENLRLDLYFQLSLDGLLGQAIAINRHVQTRRQPGQAGDVVGVFVRDEDAR